jgi:putative membrane protein
MQNPTTVIIIVLVVGWFSFCWGRRHDGVRRLWHGTRMMDGNGMMGGYGYGYGVNPLGMVLSFVSWALILAGIVLLVVWFVRNAGKATGTLTQSPLDILKARYAKGEITKEQYDAMKRDLGA